jgi:hypothetical protein
MKKSFVIPSSIEVEKNFDNIKMVLYDNGIMNIIFKENTLITMEDVSEVMLWVASLGERKYLNLMEGAYNTDIDSLVREFSASDKENRYTIADAIVISSAAHKMITDFYVNKNKPVKPTRIFSDREQAVNWLLTFK